MGLLGQGAVAIWHDIAADAREEFYSWHGREHMPERVGIPGFLRGRRYVARDADLEYFNLYEAETPAALTGPHYQERLDNPTPWTTATVRHFRHVARSICRVGASFGPGQGGLVATWRYHVPEAGAQGHIEALSRAVLPGLAEDKTVAGAHLLVADRSASETDSAERKLRGEKNRVPGWIVVVEGWGDEAPFAELCRRKLNDRILASHGADGASDFGLYRLQATASRPTA